MFSLVYFSFSFSFLLFPSFSFLFFSHLISFHFIYFLFFSFHFLYGVCFSFLNFSFLFFPFLFFLFLFLFLTFLYFLNLTFLSLTFLFIFLLLFCSIPLRSFSFFPLTSFSVPSSSRLFYSIQFNSIPFFYFFPFVYNGSTSFRLSSTDDDDWHYYQFSNRDPTFSPWATELISTRSDAKLRMRSICIPTAYMQENTNRWVHT